MLVERGVSRTYLIVFQLMLVVSVTVAYTLHPSHLLKRKLGSTVGGNPCPDPEKPFPCKSSLTCIPMAYVCDQNEDCEDAYDEDKDVCTAVLRPPVEDILSFLESEDWIVQNMFAGLDLARVAHGLAVSHNINDLRNRIGLSDEQEYSIMTVLNLVQEGRQDVLEEMGMPRSSWNDVSFIFSKLIASGFTA